jgi:1,4-alpha-glucan branching enzyme
MSAITQAKPVAPQTQATITQANITSTTTLGANLTSGGATFRAWAPSAAEVHLKLNMPSSAFRPGPSTLLKKDQSTGIWSGFVPGVKDGDTYLFYVVGASGKAFKRDPRARELGLDPEWPDCDCIVRDPGSYPWHDRGFRPPNFNDLAVYQFHFGTYYATDAGGNDRRTNPGGTFLDALFRLEHWLSLGINTVEPLPIVEFETQTSMGYNGADLFSPEMRYAVPSAELGRYLKRVNDLLTAKGRSPLTQPQIEGQVNQLKAFVDVCHVYGIAVLFDVVYNHAGGGNLGRFGFDDRSLYFFDLEAPTTNNNNSLYFTDQQESGGLIFAYWKPEVVQFLIDNAHSFYDEYHVDGFRYDQVTIIDDHGGWEFCKKLTGSLRSEYPERFQVAEYWRDDPSWVVKPASQGGAGFDAVWSDKLRGAVRAAVNRAATAFGGDVDLSDIAASLWPRFAPADAWRAVNSIEDHDITYETHDNAARIAHLADGADARSKYAAARCRVAMGLVMTAPGIPMMFMGQELLEYRNWNDSPKFHPNTLINWDDLGKVKAVGDYLRFCQELIALRNRLKGLRGGSSNPYHAPRGNRVVAFHRWVEWEGYDVVVVASLNDTAYHNYVLGFPRFGRWTEAFNSAIYENWFNPPYDGNGGSIEANGPAWDSMPYSASIVIPANSILVFVPG